MLLERNGGLEIRPIEAMPLPHFNPGAYEGNIQTDNFLSMLNLEHIWTAPVQTSHQSIPPQSYESMPSTMSGVGEGSGPLIDENEIDINDI